MKKLLLIFCLLPFLSMAQSVYTIERVFYDNVAIADTLYSKTNTDSLFRRNGANYNYAMKSGFKKIMDGYSLVNLKTVNGVSLLGNGDVPIANYTAPVFVNLAANFSNSTTIQTPVTGWGIPVTTGKTYRIEIIADYQTAALTTGGTLGYYMLTGTGTIRGLIEGDIVQTSAATGLKIPVRLATTIGATGSSLTTSGVGVINSPHGIYSVITFTCTSTGTLQIGWASEVAASAAQLNQNSTLIYQALN